MTAAVPATTSPKPQIMAGGAVAALVPQSLDEAFRVSQAIAASGLAPRGLEKPEQIMVAIMAGAELGFAPFQSLQSFAVVNGRPTLWGDGLVAVVRRNGCTIREWHDGDTAYCEVVRPDTGETIERSFSQADAVKAGLAGKTGPWQQYPQRMRAMRARAWAVRDGCADMLRGFQVAEEVQDFVTVGARAAPDVRTDVRARLEARPVPPAEGFNAVQAEPVQDVSAELDEVLDGDQIPAHETSAAEPAQGEADDDDFPGDRVARAEPEKPPIAERVAAFEKRMAEATNPTKLRSIRKAADNLFDDLEACDPERRVTLAFRYEEVLETLVQNEQDHG